MVGKKALALGPRIASTIGLKTSLRIPPVMQTYAMQQLTAPLINTFGKPRCFDCRGTTMFSSCKCTV